MSNIIRRDTISPLKERLAAAEAERDAFKAVVEKLPNIITKALNNYHTQHNQDHDGNGMLLLEVLSPPSALTIWYAKEELKLLQDHIMGAIADAAAEPGGDRE